MGPIGSPETSVLNRLTSPNNQEEFCCSLLTNLSVRTPLDSDGSKIQGSLILKFPFNDIIQEVSFLC